MFVAAAYAEANCRDSAERSSAWAASFIRLGAETGMRRGELLSLTPHVLRHSCRTWLAQKGVPVAVLNEVAGHADIRTTMIYVSVAADVYADAVTGALDSLRAA